MRTNLGSVFELDVDESSRCFRRLFVTFHGCLYGFQFCRPLLYVDGTFLKGRYKGHLLAATSNDGNQGMYLFAVSIGFGLSVCYCIMSLLIFCSFMLFCLQVCFLWLLRLFTLKI